MPEIIGEVPGVPVAKARPRFYRRGKFVGVFNSQDTEEGKFLLLSRSQIPRMAPQGVPVSLSALFFFPIPKSLPKKARAEIMAGADCHVKKPDGDNCIKFVKDCLNGVAWHDDAQVCVVKYSKTYSEQPRTVLFIKWADLSAPERIKEGV